MKLGSQDPSNYQEAEKSYKDALKRDPDNLSSLNSLHILYSNYTFQYDKAISISKQLLKKYHKLKIVKNLIILYRQKVKEIEQLDIYKVEEKITYK